MDALGKLQRPGESHTFPMLSNLPHVSIYYLDGHMLTMNQLLIKT